MGRGHLRVYLGAAPGVGKTCAMLAEGGRLLDRGTDVVIGFVETHGRAGTAALAEGIPRVAPKAVAHRATTLPELDVEAVIARAPAVALVDELAHTNVPGSRNDKRWQDVEELLDAGIDVISTVDVQHLEPLNGTLEAITGWREPETVPDDVLRGADQVEFVDLAPEALRRRVECGEVLPAEKIDAALAGRFRTGGLGAARELALLWLVDLVDDQLARHRTEHDVRTAWETRERVVVALSGGPESAHLARRAARIAARSKGADLMAVHVTRSDGLTDVCPSGLPRLRSLVERMGGSYHQVVGTNVADAVLEFARGVKATQIVLGVPRRGRLARACFPGVGAAVCARSGPIDVQLVSFDAAYRSRGRLVRRSEWGLPGRRRNAGFLLALTLLPLLTVVLSKVRGPVSLTSDILIFQAAVIGVALVGGLAPALLAAVLGSLLLNYYFTPPLHTFLVHGPETLLQLLVYVAVAVTVSTIVDRTARKSRQVARAQTESEILSTLAGDILRGETADGRRDRNALTGILERLRETYALDSVALLERESEQPAMTAHRGDPDGWLVIATAGAWPDPGRPDIVIDDTLALALRSRTLTTCDRRILEAFAAQAAVALRHQRLARTAEQVPPLAAAAEMRTTLLNTVSHDLRTPLAAAKAAVESLRSPVEWTDEDRAELETAAAESLERLERLVTNLLDMSRLQAGALGVLPRKVAVEDVVSRALGGIGDAEVEIRVPEGLPEVVADPAFLERVLANLITNAVRYTPPGEPVLLTASAHGGRLELRVVDRGPGIPPEDRDRVFEPFQRLGDRDGHGGVGLGLALSRGLAEAMGSTITIEETPGGGLTMVLDMPTGPPGEGDGPRHRPAALDYWHRTAGLARIGRRDLERSP